MDYPRLLFVAAALTATALGAKHPDDLAPDDPCVVKLGTDARWGVTPSGDGDNRLGKLWERLRAELFLTELG